MADDALKRLNLSAFYSLLVSLAPLLDRNIQIYDLSAVNHKLCLFCGNATTTLNNIYQQTYKVASTLYQPRTIVLLIKDIAICTQLF